MLAIRLQRTGKKHQPQFRIVLAEKQKHVSKKFIEILGNYNPRNKQFIIDNPERVQYWLSQHVELSPSINNLFVEKGIIQGSKVQARRVVKKEEPKAEAPGSVEASGATGLPTEATPAEEVDKKEPETSAAEIASESEGGKAETDNSNQESVPESTEEKAVEAPGKEGSAS